MQDTNTSSGRNYSQADVDALRAEINKRFDDTIAKAENKLADAKQICVMYQLVILLIILVIVFILVFTIIQVNKIDSLFAIVSCILKIASLIVLTNFFTKLFSSLREKEALVPECHDKVVNLSELKMAWDTAIVTRDFTNLDRLINKVLNNQSEKIYKQGETSVALEREKNEQKLDEANFTLFSKLLSFIDMQAGKNPSVS